MQGNVFDKYLPMTETAYYILLALHEPLHGYGIILAVEKMTEGRIRLGPGTIYGTLSKLEADRLIAADHEVDRRKVYVQTELGRMLLLREVERLEQLFGHGLAWRNRDGYV